MLRLRLIRSAQSRSAQFRLQLRCLASTPVANARAKVDVSTLLTSSSRLRLRNHEIRDFDEESGVLKRSDTRYRKQLHEKVLPKEVADTKGNESKTPEPPKKSKEGKSQNSKEPKSQNRTHLKAPEAKHKTKTPLPVKSKKPKHPKREARKALPSVQSESNISRGSGPSKEPVKAAVPLDPTNVPHLAHDLERVLFSPGVHFFKDPRTQHYNFTPFLERIVRYEDFDFDKISPFVPVSKDEILLDQAIKSNKRFYSSTSSMTLTLTQFYLFLNNYRTATPLTKPKNPRFDFPQFSRTVLDLPASVIVLPRGVNPESKKTIYAVTSDKSSDTEILLSAMGHCLEAFLTTDEEDFKRFLIDHSKPEESAPEEQNHEVNVYNYLSYGEFLMRSQLDCYDPRLPGNGTFDLKTRAVCAVRQDRASDASKNTYQIWREEGDYESFSREYEDLIRTGALLKYAFQARIGQMDGIFVAYHNVSTFFGFQYLPLEEIDRVFFNDLSAQKSLVAERITKNQITIPDDKLPSQFAELQFQASLDIWLALMDRVIKDIERLGRKDVPFRLIVKHEGSRRATRHGHEPRSSELSVYAVPLTKKREEELQSFSKNFKTSFREKITEDQRKANLQQFQLQLHELNMAIIEDSALLGYRVSVDHYLNGKLDRQPHVYPRRRAQDWHVKFKIHAENSKGSFLKERYEEVMKKVSSMLTSSMQPAGSPDKQGTQKPLRIDELRYYSKVGKLRQERWKSLQKRASLKKSPESAPKNDVPKGKLEILAHA